MTTLSARALNRATLDRQMLLRRADVSAAEAVERLVGMQAQAPFPPYTGLWTRVAGFEPDDLAKLILGRQVVRIALMRSTVHLVTAADCLALRPLLQPMLDRALQRSNGPELAGLDLDAVGRFGRELLAAGPLDTAELGRALVERWPDHDRGTLINVVRTLVPLVQAPPRAVWGRSGRTRVIPMEIWLRDGIGGGDAAGGETPGLGVEAVVLRYLAAFGPASVADAQRWSGLAGLREVFDRLRPRLRVFRAESGGELFDLPDAPRPDTDVPAPVRFLPEFDNLLLSYADGTRVLAAEHRPALFTVNGIIRAAVLVDGVARARWSITREKADRATGSPAGAVLTIEPFGPLDARTSAAIEREGLDLLAFTAADVEDGARQVRFAPAP